jgi:hypothetical protein
MKHESLLIEEDYGRIYSLAVYKWRKIRHPWWAFWRATHALEYVGRVKLEKK